jgi:serine protease Do
MLKKILQPFMLFVVFILVVGMACNVGGSDTPATVDTQEPVEVETQPPAVSTNTPEPQGVETEETSGAINSITDAKNAVIQIQAEGTFIDPEFGLQLNSAGRGSGFIIDPSGLAVTNNHVVTGAALIKVRLAGETDWRNARLVAVSECNDLAVIDIEGDGYPFFEWYQGAIDVGQEMYVAGFPLGDPEYTLTRGVISKANADGETNWASVDAVIEYDANSLPGNSGGPVLDPDGKIIGVHYAGNQSTRQAFGISRDEAEDVIDRLKAGEDVDTIGINGTAVGTEDGSLTGVWVSSVQSGSPADRAGIRPGDILYQMENLVLATDGTMADYCDILRTHQPTDTYNLSIIRWATGEILEGQLNGRELEVTGIFGSDTSSGDTGTQDSGMTVTNSGEYNYNVSASGDVAFITDYEGTDMSDFFYFLTNGNEDNFSLVVESGYLNFDIDAQNTWVYLINDQIEMADVRIDTRAENRGVNNNNISLICRYVDGRGWYEFNIANSGIWDILRYDEGPGYTTLFNGGSTNINMGRDTNDYTAVCSGNQLTLYINGVETRTVTDRTYTSGLAGFSVSSFGDIPVSIAFDDFILSIP